MISFVCPECGSALRQKREALSCDRCSIDYPVRDGIPFFSSGDYYFADIPEADMDEFLAVAQRDGWKAALHDFLRQKDEGAYKIAGDQSRMDWRFLFDLSADSTVLDMGSGFGDISFGLAHRCGQVVAMDCSLKRLRFMELRRMQEKIGNITPVCGGDTLKLPFPEGSFDLVVLNGVLEWLGIYHRELSPREVQVAKLSNIRRVLKEQGSIYIGVENRLGYVYFLGGKDHPGTRFTTLMPRVIADCYCRAVKKESYRTYTYSIFGYRKLLREAGFSSFETYATIPTYRDVFFLAKANDRAAIGYFLKYLLHTPTFKRKCIKAISRILLKAGLFRYFIPEFGIVAKK